MIYAGSCGYNNAIDVLSQIAHKVFSDSDISSQISFILVGDGLALKKLKGSCLKNMKILGRKTKIEIIELLKRSDIALFS